MSVLVANPDDLELALVYAAQRGHEPVVMLDTAPPGLVHVVDDDVALDQALEAILDGYKVEVVGKPWEAAYRAWENAGPRARPSLPPLRDRTGERE